MFNFLRKKHVETCDEAALLSKNGYNNRVKIESIKPYLPGHSWSVKVCVENFGWVSYQDHKTLSEAIGSANAFIRQDNEYRSRNK